MVVRQLCEGPAKHFLLHHRKGSLQVGADADIVILKPEKYRYDPSNSLSAVTWSSFEDREFTVKVDATFVRGALAWDGNKITNTKGSGKFIRPQRSN
jgi:allantoinase